MCLGDKNWSSRPIRSWGHSKPQSPTPGVKALTRNRPGLWRIQNTFILKHNVFYPLLRRKIAQIQLLDSYLNIWVLAQKSSDCLLGRCLCDRVRNRSSRAPCEPPPRRAPLPGFPTRGTCALPPAVWLAALQAHSSSAEPATKTLPAVTTVPLWAPQAISARAAARR